MILNPALDELMGFGFQCHIIFSTNSQCISKDFQYVYLVQVLICHLNVPLFENFLKYLDIAVTNVFYSRCTQICLCEYKKL